MASEIIGKRIPNSFNKEIYLISDFRNADMKAVVICDAIILDYADRVECTNFLKRIRSSFIESIYLIPIFILSTVEVSDPSIISLSDAIISTLDAENMQSVIENIKGFKDKFNPVGLNSVDERLITKLLRYMHSRNSKLSPVVNKNSFIGYEYPILNLHFDESEQKKMLNLLSDLAEIDYLEKTFVDKLHLCSGCFSSFINYRETCPECNAFNLKTENKLHHIACNYENAEHNFQQNDGLYCPKCKKELKNHGVDFDITAITYHCVVCKHNFEDPIISAFCFSCQKINQIDKLIEANIYSFDLIEKQTTVFVQEEIEEEKPRQTHYGFISFSTFDTFLKYEIERVRRNQKNGSIGKIELQLPVVQKERLDVRYTKLLSEIADFLKNTTLPTDILTITPNNVFLIISPENSMTKLDFLLTNIQMSVQKLLSSNFYEYDITISIRSNIIDGSLDHDELLNDIISDKI